MSETNNYNNSDLLRRLDMAQENAVMENTGQTQTGDGYKQKSTERSQSQRTGTRENRNSGSASRDRNASDRTRSQYRDESARNNLERRQSSTRYSDEYNRNSLQRRQGSTENPDGNNRSRNYNERYSTGTSIQKREYGSVESRDRHSERRPAVRNTNDQYRRSSSGRPELRNPNPSYRKNTGSRKRKRRKKKGSRAFRIGLVIYTAVLVLAVTIAILTLSSFLNTYETSLPVNVVEQAIDDISSGNYESYNIVAYDQTPISDEAAFAKDGYFNEYFKTNMSKGEVTYRKLNGESTDTEFVYAIRVGEDDFLKLCLEKQAETADFDLKTWKASGGQVLDEDLVVKTIRIQAPQNAVVYVNEIEVDDTHMVSGNVVVEQLQNLVNSGYLAEENAAYVKEMNVSGLFSNPKVTLTNADGTEEECVKNDDLYSGGFKATEEFAQARIDRVTEMIYPWCYYFSGDGSFNTLAQYLWDYSPAYNTVAAADTSWMQEHSDIGIDNIVVDNFRVYSDVCFSCDVKFQENIYQWGELARTWDSYMTWIFINGNDTFYMADYITHNSSDK